MRMKRLFVVVALLAPIFLPAAAQAGIFGRRWSPPAQPSNGYRSNSYQPTFPFNSRGDPREWREAHRGYGIKVRGW